MSNQSHWTEQKEVIKTTVQTIYAENIRDQITSIDATVNGIVDGYIESCTEDPQEILANNVTGSFGRNNTIENLMCRAIYEQCKKENYDVTLAFVNESRAGMTGSQWKYGNLFTSFPFDNEILIIETKGDELIDEINYPSNHICRSPNYYNYSFNENECYQIAVLDYMAVHTNDNREYNYFPYGANHIVSKLGKVYRHILRDYLKVNYSNGQELSPSNFSSSLSPYRK